MKSLGHLYSQVLYIFMLILGLDVMMLHLPFFFGKANALFGINLCKVYMNDDPKMTLTYIMAKSNVVNLQHIFIWTKYL